MIPMANLGAWLGFIGSIVVAIISLIGVVSSNRTNYNAMIEQLKSQSKESDAKLEKAQAVTDTKLEDLTREVRKHNSFAEKIPVLEEKIKVANNRIADLEKKVS